MNIEVQPGHYVVAVSGGVDSVALLHILARKPDIALVVAHYDHGIREDSMQDRQFVQQLAEKLGLPFVYEAGHLGANASEATARSARYVFLHSVKQAHNAKAIITAHHQDDVIETALLNMVRGTGRKGISSLQSTEDIVRPLLTVPKAEIVRYAKANNLTWREDSTNSEDIYLRNYLRHNILQKISETERKELLTHITKMRDINHEIDALLLAQINTQDSPQAINRYYFTQLPHVIAKELLAAWLRQNDIREFDRKGLERMVVAAKTYAIGRTIDVNKKCYIVVNGNDLALRQRDR
jgi:tRNA(Ile)-lysidine synthase